MSDETYRDPYPLSPCSGDSVERGAYQKPRVPVEEHIELHISRILKDGGSHRVFEVECVAHSVRFSQDDPDPRLNSATDILIRRRDVQSPSYKVHLGRGEGSSDPVSLKLPIELPRMVLKVYGDSFDVNADVSGNAHVSSPICWGTSAKRAVEPYGFELGNWSLSRYISGMTFDDYLEATKGSQFDPEAVWSDRCYCLAGVADRLNEMRTAKGIWVHSDVKPRNIVVRPLTQDGVRPRRSVELIDSDTLVFLPIAYGGTLTPVHAKGCTPRFAAPETLLRGLAERSSDIWSFGVLVFDALAGANPFGEEAGNATLKWEELHKGKVAPQLEALGSPEAQNIVRLCLDRNPLNRPEPSWLAQQLRELASLPPSGFVPMGPASQDWTTEILVDRRDWRSRYCVDFDTLKDESDEYVESGMSQRFSLPTIEIPYEGEAGEAEDDAEDDAASSTSL